MAGLNLSGAVRNYQQGVEWRQQQDEMERQKAQRAIIDGANQAATGVIEASKAERALAGAKGEYKPSDKTMLKAFEARSMALAKGGDWNAYVQNEIAVQPHRLRVRGNALQAYEADGDFGKLIQTTYPTMFDGKEIVGIERVGGMPSLASIGREATPLSYKVKLSDDTEREVNPEQVVKAIKLSLVDPAKTAEREIEENFLRLKAQLDRDAKVDVERTKGDEERKTLGARGKQDVELEGIKGTQEIALENVRFGNRRTLQREDNKAALDRTLAGAKPDKPEKTGAADKIKDTKAVHNEVTRVMGEQANTLMGSGGRISNEDTLKVSRYAKALIDKQDMEPGDAIQQAIDEWKKRRPATKK